MCHEHHLSIAREAARAAEVACVRLEQQLEACGARPLTDAERIVLQAAAGPLQTVRECLARLDGL